MKTAKHSAESWVRYSARKFFATVLWVCTVARQLREMCIDAQKAINKNCVFWCDQHIKVFKICIKLHFFDLEHFLEQFFYSIFIEKGWKPPLSGREPGTSQFRVRCFATELWQTCLLSDEKVEYIYRFIFWTKNLGKSRWLDCSNKVQHCGVTT